MRRTCCCTLFVVHHQFLLGRRFFPTKKYFVFVDETATSMQILLTAYSEKPVHKTWQTPFIHYLPYVVFSSFRPYFAVIREQCIAGFCFIIVREQCIVGLMHTSLCTFSVCAYKFVSLCSCTFGHEYTFTLPI